MERRRRWHKSETKGSNPSFQTKRVQGSQGKMGMEQPVKGSKRGLGGNKKATVRGLSEGVGRGEREKERETHTERNSERESES